MPARIPGLTPTAERTLHARLSAEIHTATMLTDGGTQESTATSLESLLPDLTRIVLEALPATPLPSEVLVLVRRTQEISDALRRDGKAGLARDIDRLAGILHGLAVDNKNQVALLDEYRYASAPCAKTDADRLTRLDRARGHDAGARLSRERIQALANEG